MTIREHHDDSERVDDADWYDDDNDVHGDDVERCPFCLVATSNEPCCPMMTAAREEP